MMLETPQYAKGNLYQLSIADLRPDPDQPRKVIDPVALEDLKASIAQLGILTPILFRVDAGHCPKPPGAVHQVISDLRFNSCTPSPPRPSP